MKVGVPGKGPGAIVRSGSTICGVLLVAQLLGCATAPPQPPDLNGNPDLDGLVLLDCSMVKRWQDILQTHTVSIWPTHCALGKVGDPSVVIPGDCWNGQLIFAGLEPGEYYLKLVEGEPEKETGVPLYRYVIREGISENLILTLAAGEVVYLGSIRITEGHDHGTQSQPHTWTFNQQKGTDTLRNYQNPEIEEMAWSLFLETYGDSRWGRLISESRGM